MDFVTIMVDDTTFLTAKHDTKATFYWMNKAIYSRSLRFDEELNDEDDQVCDASTRSQFVQRDEQTELLVQTE